MQVFFNLRYVSSSIEDAAPSSAALCPLPNPLMIAPNACAPDQYPSRCRNLSAPALATDRRRKEPRFDTLKNAAAGRGNGVNLAKLNRRTRAAQQRKPCMAQKEAYRKLKFLSLVFFSQFSKLQRSPEHPDFTDSFRNRSALKGAANTPSYAFL